MSRLTITDLTVDYATRRVLNGINLTVPQGRTLAVLGPSGCGKTTLLNAVAGLVPAAGRIDVGGADVSAQPPEKRGTVLVHQEETLFPNLDVAGNVGFAPRIRRQSKQARARRVSETLEMVGLQGFQKRPVSQLSGGEKQRVMLARALAAEPKVLLLDEPLTQLDRALRVRLRSELSNLLKRLDVTAIFVTHDQEEAAWIGDEIAVMDQGRILEQGPASRLHRSPSTPHVAQLLGRRNVFSFRRLDDGRVQTAIGALRTTDRPPSMGTLLVRSEDIRIASADGPDGVELTVTDVRHLGTRAAVTVGTEPHVARLSVHPSLAPSPGATVRLIIPPEAVHVFADN